MLPHTGWVVLCARILTMGSTSGRTAGVTWLVAVYYCASSLVFILPESPAPFVHGGQKATSSQPTHWSCPSPAQKPAMTLSAPESSQAPWFGLQAFANLLSSTFSNGGLWASAHVVLALCLALFSSWSAFRVSACAPAFIKDHFF